jgi:hypothetical protein
MQFIRHTHTHITYSCQGIELHATISGLWDIAVYIYKVREIERERKRERERERERGRYQCDVMQVVTPTTKLQTAIFFCPKLQFHYLKTK